MEAGVHFYRRSPRLSHFGRYGLFASRQRPGASRRPRRPQRLFHPLRHGSSRYGAFSIKRVRDALGRSEQAGHHRQPDHLASGQPGRSRQRRSNGSTNAASSSSAPAAICRARTGTPICYDPDGQSNELYYGIEQIGWNGHSKPRSHVRSRLRQAARAAADFGIRGSRSRRAPRASIFFPAIATWRSSRQSYDVDGVLLPRPFKIVRLGPVYLFTENLEAAADVLSRHSGLHSDRRSYLARRALFVFALQYRTSFGRRCLPLATCARRSG